MKKPVLILWLVCIFGSAVATETPESIARQLYAYYELAAPAPDLLPQHDLKLAARVQTAYLQLLADSQGQRLGYKAGLTGRAAQRRFGVDHPLLGVLFNTGLMDSPAQLPLNAGARLLVEADLVVRVSDAAINTATDWDGLLAGLDAVYPFIEVPDLLYDAQVEIDAAMLLAANVGARFGILGAAIPLTPDEDWHRRLGDFEVSMTYADGTTVQAQGHALLGHPLAAVEWLRDAVVARGEQLQPGDYLSLGSLTPLRPAQTGRVEARYDGLDPRGPVRLTLEFLDVTPQPPLIVKEIP